MPQQLTGLGRFEMKCVTVELPLTVMVWGATAEGVAVTVLYTVTVGVWMSCCVTVNVTVVRGDPSGGGHGQHSGSARAKRPTRALDRGATAKMAKMKRPSMIVTYGASEQLGATLS